MHRVSSIVLFFALGVCSACSDRALIAGGRYRAFEIYEVGEYAHDTADDAAILDTVLDIDFRTETATFTLHDGSKISTSWTTRKPRDWPVGCPTNAGATRMEILVLDVDTLAIESLDLSDPVLIADCSAFSQDVVLTEDGIDSYGGRPCVGSAGCLWFTPDQD